MQMIPHSKENMRIVLIIALSLLIGDAHLRYKCVVADEGNFEMRGKLTEQQNRECEHYYFMVLKALSEKK